MAEQKPSRTSWQQKLLLVLFGLTLVGVGLVITEGILGLLGVAEAERFVDPYVGFEEGATLFAKQDSQGGERYVTRPDKLKFFNQQSFPVEKAPGTYRIFTLGGSTTAGRPYDDQVSFSRWLERYLDAAEPSRKHEVINAGAISYASYRIVVLMKELVRYEPDLFVVLSGHNEFLEERTYRDLIGQPQTLKWLRPRLSRLRLSHLIWDAMGPPADSETSQLPDEVKTRLDVWTGLAAYERDDVLRDSVIEHFAFNLEQIIGLARAHDVDLVMVKPASNLKDFSPFKSAHSAGLVEVEQKRFRELMSVGKKSLEAGDGDAALDAFEVAKTIDPDYADLHFRMGRALLQKGDFDAAYQALVRAKELDVAPLRSLDSLQDLVSEVALREGVPLIDLLDLLETQNESRLGHRILGNEVFLDHVHPDIATHSLIAQRLMTKLAEDGLVRLDAAWTQAEQQAIYDGVVSTLDPQYYARRDLNLAKVLGWAGKLEEAEPPLRRAAEVLDGEPDLHLNLGILWQKTGRPELAVEQLERAVALDPESPEGHFNLGVTYGRLGRLVEGIGELEAAIELYSDYPEAHHNLSILQRQAGDPVAAITAAQRALELQPEAAEVHRALGLAFRMAGRFDDARAAFAESLRRDPGNSATRTELAITLAMEGRLDEAITGFEQAIESSPDDPEAHYNLARTLAQLGRTDEAARSYERVLQLDSDHALAHNNLGLLSARRGDLEGARQHLVRAIEIDPSYAEALLNLGVVFDMAGRPEAAVQAMERALSLRPDDPKIHFGLAMLYWATDRREASLPHFEAARLGGETIPPEIAQQLQ